MVKVQRKNIHIIFNYLFDKAVVRRTVYMVNIIVQMGNKTSKELKTNQLNISSRTPKTSLTNLTNFFEEVTMKTKRSMTDVMDKNYDKHSTPNQEPARILFCKSP